MSSKPNLQSDATRRLLELKKKILSNAGGTTSTVSSPTHEASAPLPAPVPRPLTKEPLTIRSLVSSNDSSNKRKLGGTVPLVSRLKEAPAAASGSGSLIRSKVVSLTKTSVQSVAPKRDVEQSIESFIESHKNYLKKNSINSINNKKMKFSSLSEISDFINEYKRLLKNK